MKTLMNQSIHTKNLSNQMMLDVNYSDISEKINLHSVFLSRLRDKSDECQGKLEFNFQKDWIVLTSYSGYGFFRTKTKCDNKEFHKFFIKPIVVDIKDIQFLMKSFEGFGQEYVVMNCSDSSLGVRLPSDSSKKVKNSVRICDVSFGKIINKEKVRSIEGVDAGCFSSIISRVISKNTLTDSGSYFDFLNLTINNSGCRATSGNGSFFSSIKWKSPDGFTQNGSWSFSIATLAMMLKILKKSKSKDLSIIEYGNYIKFKLDSFEIISLDKFESDWPDVNTIIKRNNDIAVLIDANSAKLMREFLIPVFDQAQRDKVDVPSVSLSFDLLENPSLEIQSNFQKEMYFTLDKESFSVEKNEKAISVFGCNVSLKSLIDSLNTAACTSGVEFKMSEGGFNGHSAPVLVEHIDTGGTKFCSFFAQVD